MDKPSKLERWLTIVANLAVVGGILLVAVELRQNTRAIQAQTRDSITEKQMEYLGWLATNSETAVVAVRADSLGRGSLNSAELRMWNAFNNAVFREWENSYYQYRRGLFSEEEFEARLAIWRGSMVRAGQREAWEEFRLGFAPDFRAEIDAIVAEIEN